MNKKYPIIKRSLLTLFALIVITIGFGYWFIGLIPASENPKRYSQTTPDQLTYVVNGVKENRGKILAVVTSSDMMGSSGKSTGYELTELARAYYVFKANGFEVDVASPKGGKPPVVIDDDDMGKFDFAFLNDKEAQNKVDNSIMLDDVNSSDYEGVYFVGGKGAMFDFPDNSAIQAITRDLYQSGKVIAAICHGPAALVNVQLDDGSYLLESKNVSSFTNSEELLLIPDAESIFPFLLESRLTERGAEFKEGLVYLEQISQDGNLVTGQNPWSVWALAESTVKQLGYEPIPRVLTDEENSVRILTTYQTKGYQQAKAQAASMTANSNENFNRTLIAMHSIVAVMQWELGHSVGLIRLLASTQDDSEN